VVSQIPESETKRSDTSGLSIEVKRVKVGDVNASRITAAGEARAAEIDEKQERRMKATSCPHARKGCLTIFIVASVRGFER
jgi:hypothetical protein